LAAVRAHILPLERLSGRACRSHARCNCRGATAVRSRAIPRRRRAHRRARRFLHRRERCGDGAWAIGGTQCHDEPDGAPL